MQRQFVTKNAQERERLRNLVNKITDEELTLVLYKEGWTIAVALAHLAFWDMRRLILVRRWKKKCITPSPIDTDLINDALLPFFLSIPPREAANLSVRIAEELDQELETISPELISAIRNLKDRHALNRSAHRKMHLDEIEKLLSTRNR